MNNRTAIVTGTSSGFGYYTVIELVKLGFHVIATVRNQEKANQLKENLESKNIDVQQVTIELLELTDTNSIQSFTDKLHNYNTIDILVNNAGFVVGGFVEEISIEQFHKQFETNVFGLIAVTQAVIPFMRKQKQGKIINISSGMGLMGFPSMSPYAASKHAVEGFTESLRLELKPFGIHSVLIEPGAYATSMVPDYQNVEQSSPYSQFNKNVQNSIKNFDQGNPIDVAKLVAAISQMNKPKLRYPIGKGVKSQMFMKNLLPWNMWEKIMLKVLKM
ncbi:SDR family oxidoreductase [Chengkuizengella sp. SCS-71B]|uniref:SDR family oxidoreductase n=1 Tax=Chengkuizengella sp. SCS-71B TaxID=3115290 RepID=UPI0032C210FE